VPGLSRSTAQPAGLEPNIVGEGRPHGQVRRLDTPSELRLSGLVNFRGTKLAILEGERRFGGVQAVILEPGQSDFLGVKVELMGINAGQHSATVRIGHTNQLTLVMRSNPPVSGVVVEEAAMDATLDLYARLAQRILLRHPRLPRVSFTVAASARTQTEAMTGLKDALARAGMISIEDGDRFLMLVPQSEAQKVQPRSAQLKASDHSELQPAGFINFPGTDLNQVTAIYAELLGQRLDREGPILPAGIFYLKTMTPMTRNEALYAFETLYAWRGLKLVPSDNGMVKLVLRF